jgi:phosphonopyruvate decarboxylase
MLNTEKFINKIIAEGYTHFCVVPCSFAKDVINASINNNGKIEYLPCASEAVACSVAAGLKMSGKRPIVIVQSSGITNMGSCITSLLKPYGITFPIIVSWRSYKSGDSEIQHQHLASKLPDLVSSYGYDYVILDNDNISNALSQINKSDKSSQICLLEKSSFSTIELEKKHMLNLSDYTPRSKFLSTLNNKFKETKTLFIGTTGNTAREMYSFMPNTENFYMAGNMGGALSLGLGVSLSGKSVIVCGGDAEFVMHMGGLTTAGRYNEMVDLTYILFDNESNKSTGGQNSYQSHVDYINIAKSSNINVFDEIVTSLEQFNKVINESLNKPGVKFICVKCGFDNETPRPPLEVVKINEIQND